MDDVALLLLCGDCNFRVSSFSCFIAALPSPFVACVRLCLCRLKDQVPRPCKDKLSAQVPSKQVGHRAK